MPFLTELHKILYLFLFQNAFQTTSYQPPNLYSVVPPGLAPVNNSSGVLVLGIPQLYYFNGQCESLTIHTRWSSSCSACHLPRETGALDRLWPFFYLVLITASVECHHLTSAGFNMVSCTNKTKDETFRKHRTCPPLFLIRSALCIAL